MEKKELYEKISTKILDAMVKQFGHEQVVDASLDIFSVCILTIISTHIKREHWNECVKEVAEALVYNMEKCTSLMPVEKDNG